MTRSWILPSDLLPVSIEMMEPPGRKGNEGLAFWLGREVGTTARITHAVELRGAGFVSSPLQLRVSALAMDVLTDFAEQEGVFLVGQVHSHPEDFIDLSWVDEAHGIHVDQYLSVVCPFYAQRPNTTLSECGLHVFDRQAYRRMTGKEVDLRVRMGTHRTTPVRLEVPS